MSFMAVLQAWLRHEGSSGAKADISQNIKLPRNDNPVPGRYFTAAPWKLALMSVCTMGIYEFYWFYKNWKFYAERTGYTIRPAWRATLVFIWAFNMFNDIRQDALKQGVGNILYSVPFGIAYCALLAAHWLPDPFSLLSTFTFIPLLYVNDVAQRVNQSLEPSCIVNDRLSTLNWLVIVFGGLCFIATAGFIFLPAAAPHFMPGPEQFQELLKSRGIF